MKMDHPSFFDSFHIIHTDGGFLPAGVPSSLSESAGNGFALPGELVLFPNGDTPQNNRPALSSIAGRRRNSLHTSGSTPPPKTKKASDPCNPSEAMIKINYPVELLVSAELFV